MTFEQLPKDQAFRLSGNDLTVFKIDPANNLVRIWFRDLQSYVGMPNHMLAGFMRRIKTREAILVDKLPTL